MSANTEQRLQQQVDELMISLAAEREARQRAESERDEYLRITAECRDACGDWYEHPEAMGDPHEVPAVIIKLKQRAEAAEARIKELESKL